MAASCALGVVLVIVTLAVIDLLRIRADLVSGTDKLSELSLDTLGQQGLGEVTADAGNRLRRAADRARSSPWLSVVAPLPVVGDQVRGLRDLSRAAGELGELAERSGATIATALEGAGTPEGRLDLLDAVLVELDEIEAAVASVEVGDGSGLLGPLADAHDEAVEQLDSVPERFAEARSSVEAVQGLLRGPTRLVVLAGNNAEMTAGAGMPLSMGIAEISDGDIVLDEFFPTRWAQLTQDPVRPPGDLADLYWPMGLGGDFRGSTATPNFPAVGALVAEMAERTPLGEVDGVVLVDAVMLRHLLAVIGPVEIDGVAYDHENVVEEVLYRNYLRFDGERGQRIEMQSEIAKGAFEALKERDVDVAALARAMQDAATGRHLLAWSKDPAVQDLWGDLGASGELHPPSLMVSTQNYDGNKLDWFLRPELQITTGVTPRGHRRVHLTVTLEYPDLSGETVSDYIVGRTPDWHFSFVDFHLPEGATDIVTDHPDGFWTAGNDPPMVVRTMLLRVDANTTEQRTVSFTLPRDVEALLLLPGARVHPMPVTVDDWYTVTDQQTTVLLLERPTEPAGSPTSVRVLVVLAAASLWLAAATLAVGSLGQTPLASRLRLVAERGPALPAVAQVLALTTMAALVAAGALTLILYDRPV